MVRKNAKKAFCCFMALATIAATTPETVFAQKTEYVSIETITSGQGIKRLAVPLQTSLDLQEEKNDRNGDGFSWNASTKELTLEDGFSLDASNQKKSALLLPPEATIVLKGKADIVTNNTAIEANGNLTVKSADNKNGKLTVTCSRESTTYMNYYGIDMPDRKKLTITEHSIVEVTGGYASLRTASTDTIYVDLNKASSLKLYNSNRYITEGNVLLNSSDRIIWDADKDNTENNGFQYLKEHQQKQIGTLKQLKLVSCMFDGKANTDESKYTLTYNGQQHGVEINQNESSKVLYKPTKQITYQKVVESEFLDKENVLDYREKRTESQTTQYAQFYGDQEVPVNACEYEVIYNENRIGTLLIEQRRVLVSGIQALDKTFDWWKDAKLNYDKMQITCINDSSSKEGLVANDRSMLGKTIIPYAKGYFITPSTEISDVSYLIDGQRYIRNKDVAYKNNQIVNGTVVAKNVWIGDYTLSNPNYIVEGPGLEENKSQALSKATIYPRKLSEKNYISTELTPGEYVWKKGEVWRDVEKKVMDKSWLTKNSTYTFPSVLKRDIDYTVSSNTYEEIGEQTVVFTGRGNFVDSVSDKWNIRKAVRKIEIMESDSRIFDNQPYSIQKEEDFRYQIKDVDNDEDVTDDLEEGSDLTITYKGIGETVYPESTEAPKNAGSYCVTISVNETRHYTKALEQRNFVIHPKEVTMKWYHNGIAKENPENIVYEKMPQELYAVVTNVVEGTEVHVTKVNYGGTSAFGTVSGGTLEAPQDVGDYIVTAVELDNPNYIIGDGNTHTYHIVPATVSLEWQNTDTVYHAKDLSPYAIVKDLYEGDICKVCKVSYEGTDVYGNPYTQEDGVVNVTNGTCKVTAVELDNPNYKLPQDSTTTFKMSPLDLGTLDTPDQIWSHVMPYTGYEFSPVLEWNCDGDGEVLKMGRDYKAENYVYASEPKQEPMDIRIFGKNNYTGQNEIQWNVKRLESSIKITTFGGDDPTKCQITYGEELEEKVEYQNADIQKDNYHDIEFYTNYSYTGITDSGKEYKSIIAPKEAGTYTMTVTLMETPHFEQSVDSVEFKVMPKKVSIVSGISVHNKSYDGTKDATLDLRNAEYKGVYAKDLEAFKEYMNIEKCKYVSGAQFAQKDVLYREVSEATKVVTDMKVLIGANIHMDLDPETDPELLFNYDVSSSENQADGTAAIYPKEIRVSGITAKDKIYDGTSVATLNKENVTFDGLVDGEKMYMTAKGTFTRTDNEASGKDVLLDEEGNPQQKRVNIEEIKLYPDSKETDMDNYVLAKTGQQTKTAATIEQAVLTIKGIKIPDKTYDGTVETGEIDWSNVTLDGVAKGENILLDMESGLPQTGKFSDCNVAYDRYNNVAAKSIQVSNQYIRFIGDYIKSNYKTGEIVLHAKINPALIDELTWNLSSKGIPVASVSETCTVLPDEKDTCIVNTVFYEEGATQLAKPIPEEQLEEGKTYMVKAVKVINGNYEITSATKNQTLIFQYVKPNKQDEGNKEPGKNDTIKTAISTKAMEQMNAKLLVKVDKSAWILTWGKVTGADGYRIYRAEAGGKYSSPAIVKDGNSTTYRGRNIDTKTVYRICVEAYKIVDKKTVLLGKSIPVYVCRQSKPKYNVKSISVKNSSVVLNVGLRLSIKATAIATSNKTVSAKTAALRFISSNEAIAKVSSSGIITACKKGKCTIYVYAKNGVRKAVSVMVE